MDPGARNRSTLEKCLVTAGERLCALRALLDGGAEVGALRVEVAFAMGALAEAQSVVTDPREAERVACRFCGYQVMSDATLCLFCWRKLDPMVDKRRPNGNEP